MMVSPKELEFSEYFQLIRESAEPGVWSKSVALARLPRFEFSGGDSQKISFRVSPDGEVISPRVDLFIEEEDWQCSCSYDEDPCHHVVATCILIRRLQNEGIKEFPAQTKSRSPITYLFSNDSGSLYLRRAVLVGGEQKLFMCPLSSFVSNSEKSYGDVSITETDLQVEKILGAIKSGVFDGMKLSRIISVLMQGECSEIYVENQKVSLVDYKLSKPKFRLKMVDEMFNLLSLDDGALQSYKNGFILNGSELVFYSDMDEFNYAAGLVHKYSHFSKMELSDFLTTALKKIEKYFDVDLSAVSLPRIVQEKPYLVTTFCRPDDDPCGEVSYQTEIVYGRPVIAKVKNSRLELVSSDSLPERDQVAEKRLADQYEKITLKRLGEQGLVSLSEAVAMSDKLAGISLTSGLKVENHRNQEFYLRLGQDGFQMGLSIGSPDGSKKDVDGADLLRVFESGASYINLQELGVSVFPREVIERCYEQLKRVYQLSSRGIDPSYYAHEVVKLAEPLNCKYENGDGVVNFLGLLDVDEVFADSHPVEIKGRLRDYQSQASAWLRRLQTYQAGAMLADEMGLGKTLQAITVFSGKTLVIVPTSLVKNWMVEIDRFRPELRVCVFHGASRVFDDSADVIITTYGILRNEIDRFSSNLWDVVVLDEAQAIKNSSSLLSAAVKELKAKFRLALSGTPMENALSDLWSQFDFILPGLLGEEADFNLGSIKLNTLNSLIRPFYLRRLKKDVAKELPEKIETILYSDMKDDQRAHYDTFLSAVRSKVALEKKSGVGAIETLEAILRLRQICCHTGLLGLAPLESNKVEILREKASELVGAGEKILVFSQWTSFLDLIEADLQGRNLKTFRLDGATSNRGEVVDDFKSYSGGGVFLISLKAGGTGLNLTEASHVFIMDPWWNPAVENQAIDRAHRIGQKQIVNIYRIVTVNSIEEKIILLQEDKKKLLDSIESGAAEEISKITRDQMLELFD